MALTGPRRRCCALAARLGEVLSRETLCKIVGSAVNERAIDVCRSPGSGARSSPTRPFRAICAPSASGLSAGRRMTLGAVRDAFERIARFADRHSRRPCSRAADHRRAHAAVAGAVGLVVFPTASAATT